MSEHKKDDPQEFTKAHEWLSHVAELLELPQEIERRSVKPILDLTKDVAHNRSRPAAPVTSFLVGVAAGLRAQGLDERQIQDAIDECMAKVAAAARD